MIDDNYMIKVIALGLKSRRARLVLPGFYLFSMPIHAFRFS